METTQRDVLIVNWKTVAVALITVALCLAAALSRRAWAMTAVPAVLSLMVAWFYVTMARRYHVLLIVAGLVFAAWALWLLRFALTFYPN
jgi:hypothetical protein